MQESTGFERPLSGQYSANIGAWLISSAWAHRWWAPYLSAPSEVLFPGILAIVLGCWGATFVDAIATAIGLKRDVALVSTSASRIFTFWLTFGPKAGLYTLLYYTVPVFSFLRAPSRAGIVVTLCLVVLAAPALIVADAPAGRQRGVRDPARAGVADLYRAPLRMREAPPLPHAYRRWRAAEGAGDRVAVLGDEHRLSPPRGIHAGVDRALAAAHQRLQRSHPAGLPRQRADARTAFPSRESFAILEPLGARYAVFHLDLMDADDRAIA